jgi:3,4-dihydroxy 2-butanone 4-phosphate synthase/GTP cyclohydrolase II
MSSDGTMARLPELETFGRKHGIKILSIEALAQYRRKIISYDDPSKQLNAGIVRNGESIIPTDYGEFRAIAYQDLQNNDEHLVLCMGDLNGDPPLVRLHSSCLTGDLFGSRRCDCGEQLQLALRRIAQTGRGVLIYLQQEGRGIGLTNKIRAYALQDHGCDTVDANLELGFPVDCRSYRGAVAILRDLKIESIRLMTNNPDKVSALEEHHFKVVERVAHEIRPRSDNIKYLRTKAQRMAHILPSVA